MFFSKNIIFQCGIGILFVLLFIIIFSNNGIIDCYHLSQAKQGILFENKKIENKNLQLLRQIHRLTHDKIYIEHVAKHEFGMAGADELVFRTISNKKSGINIGVAKP